MFPYQVKTRFSPLTPCFLNQGKGGQELGLHLVRGNLLQNYYQTLEN